MWWVEAHRDERAELLLVLRADTVDAGWLTPPSAGDGVRRWQSLQVAIDADDAACSPGGAGLHAGAQAALKHMQELLLDPSCGPPPASCRRLVVLLASPFVGLANLPWSDRLLREDAVLTHARGEFQSCGFEPRPDDILRVDGQAPLGAPRAAMWLPHGLWLALQSLAEALDLPLASVQALSAVAAGWAVRPARWPGRAEACDVAVVSRSAMHIVHGGGAMPRVGLELSDALPDSVLEDRVTRLWQRARIRFPALQSVKRLRVISIDEAPPPPVASPAAAQPLDWVSWPQQRRAELDRALLRQSRVRPTLDAVPPRRSPVAAAWPLATALCLVAAAALTWQAWQRQTAIELTAAADAGPAMAPSSPPLTSTELAELRSVNAAIRRINLPLPALMRTLQPPRDIAVALLGLDLSGEGDADEPRGTSAGGDAGVGKIKLTAESASALDMTHYVTFLAGRQGVSMAQLVSHEMDATPSERPYRFAVELSWQR